MLKTMSFFYRFLCGAISLVCFCTPAQAAPNPSLQCAGVNLKQAFTSDTAWSMCLSLDDQEGLTVNQLTYTTANRTRRVLGKGSLAQLETVFDDNRNPPSFATTREGFGGNQLISLKSKDCEGGSLYADQTGRKVICSRLQTAGLLYNYAYQAQRQTSFLEIFSISQTTDFQTYTQRWRFYENGVIEPALGFSGKIPRYAPVSLGFGRTVKNSEQLALGFSNYLGWRLDFDLGKDSDNDRVKELTSTLSASRRQRRLGIAVLDTEAARDLNPELKTTWLVEDGDEVNEFGQAIAYEIIPSQYYQSTSNVRGRPWLANDLYFTRYKECEKYASDNNSSDCARNVLHYIQDKENINRADLVVWYKQHYHYLPRSDDSDYISTDWVSFQLMPRDWTAGNPL
ncbi:MAG: hypothetical protein E6Q83_19320 [Thiothrix sp.]|nr:MAG: hypothetical protein E6Q83_19320 [Thiothrix sp.]